MTDTLLFVAYILGAMVVVLGGIWLHATGKLRFTHLRPGQRMTDEELSEDERDE